MNDSIGIAIIKALQRGVSCWKRKIPLDFWKVARAGLLALTANELAVERRHEGSNPLPSASLFGKVVERLMAAVLKTAGPKGSAGSNPVLSASFDMWQSWLIAPFVSSV